MTLIQYYDVPQNIFITISLPRVARGLRIANNSNQFITVRDDLGHTLAQCPPGISAAWNVPEGLYSPQIGCIGFYQGNARVYFYDSQVDVSGNPPLQQPPGSVTTTDALTEQLLTAIQTLLGTTNTNTGGTVTNTGSLITLINALNNLVGTTNTNTGGTATNTASLITLINTLNNLATTTNALDTDIRAYLAALQGLLPVSITTLTFGGGWSEQTIGPLTTARQGFSIAVQRGALDGFLWVAYLVGGTRIYVEEMGYWGRQQAIVPTQFPTWITYDESLPSGASIVVGTDAAMNVLVRV